MTREEQMNEGGLEYCVENTKKQGKNSLANALPVVISFGTAAILKILEAESPNCNSTFEVPLFAFTMRLAYLISKYKTHKEKLWEKMQGLVKIIPEPLPGISSKDICGLLTNENHTSSFVATTANELKSSLILYDHVIASSLPNYFLTLQKIVEDCVELGVHDIAHTIGKMTTNLLNCSDEHTKASRTLYYWCEGTISLLDTFSQTLRNFPSIDGDILPNAVFENGLKAMEDVVNALIDCQHRLSDTKTLAISLLMQLHLITPKNLKLQYYEENAALENGDSSNKVEKVIVPATTVVHDKQNREKTLDDALLLLPDMIEGAKNHISNGLEQLQKLQLDTLLVKSKKYDWQSEHLDAKLTATLLSASSDLIQACKEFQKHHQQFKV